ncbi:hypothetical protein A1QO_10750 [Vibrio genomosp. F10 str. ZF-129]|uniref:Bacterial sugar transferase domain-containing protein n=1 Tax=Vibrio genomosp. F10 str. ZF-129 TaxID=1187848 RepID=A0A1E5BDD2_9VIBR|nr:sugar transferase [Vibrio genomosp. F10]OEE33151.1 hypothetical protein A1QO_10750 [Vibrio genomosp. F10 str. ZF-129]
MTKQGCKLSHLIVLFLLLIIQVIGTYTVYRTIPSTVISSLCIVTSIFLVVIIILPIPTPAILQTQTNRIIPLIFSCYGIAFFMIMLLRLEYSRPILLSGIMLTTIWFILFYYWAESRVKLDIFSLGKIKNLDLSNFKSITVTPISKTHSIKELSAGILVDLHSNLTPEEERLLADFSLANIPVYHSGLLSERITHKVSELHLSENTLGTLQPDYVYLYLKILLDKLTVIILSPFIIITLTIALMLKITTNESVFFRQKRIGFHNQIFTIYKFRTMTSYSEKQENRFATEETQRITKFGVLLRKSRLDEIPQFWNVIKGDMSLIGPRPEQAAFVDLFCQEIPFYNYRHVVKPGMSGLAQVSLGYTDDVIGTKEKVAYDLYYIKHLSWALDFEIFLKTVKVMFTGKGAI